MKLRYGNRGISLLEVAIVFAITSVMVAATLPNFQDYTIRARVNEALEQASGAQDALIQTCLENFGAVVESSAEVPYRYKPTAPENDFVGRIDFAADCSQNDLAVTIWTFNTGASTDPIIEWFARVPEGASSEDFEEPSNWDCRIIRGDWGHVPPECRKRYRRS